MQINIETIEEDGKFSSTASTASHTGKVTKLVTKPVSDVTVINEFSDMFFKSLDTGVLNIGLRYMSPDRRVIMFEQPPRYVDFNYTAAGMEHLESRPDAYTATHFTIPVPWLLYCALLDSDCSPVNIYVFTLAHQLQSMADPIGMLPLTNFHQDGRLCRAPQDSNEMSFPKDISGAMAAVYYAVWMTGFNNDLLPILNSAREHRTPSFLGDVKLGKDASHTLEYWGRQPVKKVAEEKYPSTGWRTIGEFIAGNRIRQDFEIEMTNYFVNRLSSAIQTASFA